MAIDINYSETRGPNVDDFLSPQPTLSCFLPVCLYSFMASRTFLQEYLPWAISRCSRAKIVIGDYLERHNIMVFNSLPEDEAIEKARRKGEKITRIINKVIETIDRPNEIEITSCRVDLEREGCKSIAQVLRQFVESNDRFRNDLEDQVRLMMNGTQRISHHSLSGLTDSMMHQLREYMIEEVALYLYLYQQGFTTEIYPGRDMKVLRKIAANQYRGFPYDFSERTHISVAVLLDSGTSYARLDDNNGEGDTRE